PPVVVPQWLRGTRVVVVRESLVLSQSSRLPGSGRRLQMARHAESRAQLFLPTAIRRLKQLERRLREPKSRTPERHHPELRLQCLLWAVPANLPPANHAAHISLPDRRSGRPLRN